MFITNILIQEKGKLIKPREWKYTMQVLQDDKTVWKSENVVGLEIER